MGHSRIQPWVVCLASALFFFFEFIQLNVFNVIGSGITRTFQVDASVLASISDKYFLANIIFLFPAGMLLDRVSTRRAILIGMLASVICTCVFSVGTEIWHLKVARFITGIAASFCLLSCVRLTSRWFAAEKMALVVGLIVTLAMLGGMIAQAPFAMLMNAFGWRVTMTIDAAFGVTLLIMIFIFVKDSPSGLVMSEEHGISLLHGKAFWVGLATVLRNRQNWLCGLFTSLMNFPVFLLGALWGVFYLTQARHLDNDVASIVTSFFFLGFILGSPTVGWLSDRMRRRKMPMLLGAGASLFVVLFLIFAPNLTSTTLSILFFTIGLVSSVQILSYPLIVESNPLHLTGTAEGMASALIMAGGFTQQFFAYLMQINWAHVVKQGTPFYSKTDYQVALSIMPVAFLLSFVLALFIKETHCKPYRGNQ